MESFRTRSQSNNGHLWDEPVSSGPIGNNISLSGGECTIKLVATRVDEHGIEIDRINLGLLYTSYIPNPEGLCSNTHEQDSVSDKDSWDRGHIIGVSVGVITITIGIVSTVIGVITLITGIYYHHKKRDPQAVVLVSNER